MEHLNADETLREAAVPDDSAHRILQLQQKLEAWDRLYNEEIEGLRRELADLTARYLRNCEVREPAISRPGRKRRTAPLPST
jgi:hypothetical protein